MREGRRPDKGLPPTSGKRRKGREHSGRLSSPARVRINFTPRPHTIVSVRDRNVNALIDTGSEISCMNAEIAMYARDPKRSTKQETLILRLAGGTTVPAAGMVTVKIVIGGAAYRHTFAIVPNLEPAVLIGVDLWGRTRAAIPAVPYSGPVVNEISKGLATRTSMEDNALKQFLERETRLFQAIRGPTRATEHDIKLTKAQPIRQRYQPRNPRMQKIIDDEVAQMLRDGVIEPSTSAWSSPVVIVRKKDGAPRFCIDFRRLNEVTERDAYPLPQVTATLEKLRGARYLSTLDLQQGYWQIPLSAASRPLTAFTVPGRGLFQFRVMPFGLHSASATFQRLMDRVLGPELEPNVFVYLDDIIVVSADFSSHLKHLTEVFSRLRAASLKINTAKCSFCCEQLKYLGHVVDRDGLHTDPEKIAAIADWAAPGKLREVRQFLGVASWYRRFVPNFARVAAPLTQLTRKGVRWKWDGAEQGAFDALKAALISAPILACPDFSRRFVLQTDASLQGLGAVLTQQADNGERVIAYASRSLSDAERNYTATELECLAVIWGIRRMRGYVEGYEFTVVTDHQSLRWLQKLEAPSGRLARWMLELQQFTFDVRYRPGRANKVADALSRQPRVAAIGEEPPCPWYQRVRRAVKHAPETVPDYALRNGNLFRHILHSLDFRETPEDEQWKRCVPREDRREILRQLHDDPTAGHLGVAKTISRVARIYYWPGMFREIARYVRACRSCLAHKAIQQRPAGLLHASAVGAPWEQVSVDFVGPLPRSTKGHAWLLSVQDRFTKWVELRPLRRATTEAVVRVLREDVTYRHGSPEVIISDNGRQFRSRQFGDFLRQFGIRHRTTPPYTPQCNPVERANRTVKTMIAQYLRENQRIWDDYVPALQFALNTAMQESTGYTPAYLTYGRELRIPGVQNAAPRWATERPDAHWRQLEDVCELVRIRLARAFQKQAAHYNLRHRPWKPRIGDRVWKREHPLSSKAEAFNAKLAARFRGPLTVTDIISPVVVTLRDDNGRTFPQIHVRELKPDWDADPPAPEREPVINTDRANSESEDDSQDESTRVRKPPAVAGSTIIRRRGGGRRAAPRHHQGTAGRHQGATLRRHAGTEASLDDGEAATTTQAATDREAEGRPSGHTTTNVATEGSAATGRTNAASSRQRRDHAGGNCTGTAFLNSCLAPLPRQLANRALGATF